jgi:hypothetical protein
MDAREILTSEEAPDLLFGALLRKADGLLLYPTLARRRGTAEWHASITNAYGSDCAGYDLSPLLALLRALDAAGRLSEESK